MRLTLSLLLVITALTMRVASDQTANASYLALAAFALFGRAEAIQALGLSWLFSMLSLGVAPEASDASIGRFEVMAAAAVSVLLRSDVARGSMRVRWPVLATLLLGAFFVLHSVLFSTIPSISILKAVSWTVSTATLLAAWSSLATRDRSRLEMRLFGCLAGVLILSLPLLALNIGYLRNGTGFQGILGHPQVFGPSMALLAAWLSGNLMRQPKPSWGWLLILGGAMALVLASEARTAGLALLAGVPAAVLLSILCSHRRVREIVPGLASSRLLMAFLLVGVAFLNFGSALADRLRDFVQKRRDSASILEAYESSRGRLISSMASNIEHSPLQGIGFGIASEPSSMVVKRDPWLGLPVGATIEKGVMPLAVLEELGIPGFLAVAAWVFMLLRRAGRGGIVSAAVLCTALFTNMGESTLLSPGGMGLLILILISWAGTARGEPHSTNSEHA